jgi:hypothetical protein
MKPSNLRLSTSVAAALAVASLAACERHHNDGPPAPLAASPSAQVIGVAPAPPTGDPPGTTPVSANTTEVSKAVEQQSMPLPGQPNDHSNLARLPSENAETQDVNKSPAAAKQANSGPPADERK